ncbi:MAG: undecaprenyl-phosphate alpha-N-acetylglucosaminyl 1-phosphate transferase [Isosphaeraceae bacterium]|jgi:UDP-GlcNAc:undecaprenyl-phosphate GlcNAc-1-phosphate transferase|nr:MAG: undecaprenyl-phosphate alpha-N-acetylglucosaminyl 1-phosphate transferase [Isosphaeraceae bacterium]
MTYPALRFPDGPWTLTLAAVALASTAFALSLGLGAVVRQLAPRFGLVDQPGGRKVHRAATPLGGGVAIWASVIAVVALAIGLAALFQSALPESWRPYLEGASSRLGQLFLLLALASVIMFMGLADDRFRLGWKPRLAIQFVVAGLYVYLGEQATFFNANRWLTGAVTVFWIVGLTNAFNFLDNMDGLAAGVGLIACLLFAGAQVAVGSLFVPALLVVLAGALAGFLIHNRPPARLFMGDAGSNFLGFLLGTLTVAGTFTREGYSPLGVLAPLMVMAVPLYDTVSVIVIRIRQGRSPFQPDRSHFSHRLVERGLTPPRAVATICLVTLASGLGALLLHRVTNLAEAAVLLGQTVCLIGVVVMLELGTLRRDQCHEPSSPTSTPANRNPGQPATVNRDP